MVLVLPLTLISRHWLLCLIEASKITSTLGSILGLSLAVAKVAGVRGGTPCSSKHRLGKGGRRGGKDTVIGRLKISIGVVALIIYLQALLGIDVWIHGECCGCLDKSGEDAREETKTLYQDNELRAAKGFWMMKPSAEQGVLQ